MVTPDNPDRTTHLIDGPVQRRPLCGHPVGEWQDTRITKEIEAPFQRQVKVEVEEIRPKAADPYLETTLAKRAKMFRRTRGILMEKKGRLTPETRRSEPPLPAPPSDSLSKTFALFERVVLDPRANVEKLDRVMELYERFKAKEAELAYNAAKGRILKKLAGIKITKNRPVLYEIEKGKPQTGSYEAFKYAPLEQIDKHLRPLLAEENMDLSFSNEPREGGGILIRGRLKHLPSGHYEDFFMPSPLDTSGGKSAVQAVGSTNSFLRRYVACNIFNIVVVGDDDDGNGGTVDEVQTKTIIALIEKAKVGPKFLKYMKAQSVEEAGSLEAAVATIAARDYRKAISTLEEQIGKEEANHANLS